MKENDEQGRIPPAAVPTEEGAPDGRVFEPRVEDLGPLPGGATDVALVRVPRVLDIPPVLQEMNRLDPRAKDVWRVSGVLSTFMQSGLLLVPLVFLVLATPLRILLVLPLWFFGMGLVLIWALVSPGLAWERWRYRMTEGQLELVRGIIVHRTTRVPLSRIQHVDVEQGPIERMYELATLVVHTAGTHGAVVRLPGVTRERAEQLRDLLVDVDSADGV